MGPELNQANQQLAGVFDTAVNSINGQTPAIQNLYNTLLSGLSAQTGQQVQSLNQSAAQRGVLGGELGQNISGQLGQANDLQQALINSQRAQAIAGQGQLAGQANVARGQAAGELAGTINKENLQIQEQQQNMTDLERKYQIRQEQYRQEQARAAAAAASKAASLSTKALEGSIQAALNQVRGGDGKVSPQDYRDMLQVWASKGLDPSEFHNKFSGYVNLGHGQDYYNPKAPTYANVPISNINQLRF